MARKVTPMQTRLVAAVARAVGVRERGERINVRRLAAELGVTSKTFYKWARRYEQEGLEGLEERSRRPHRSPKRISPMVEDAIVEMRKRLAEEGLDAGAATIRWHLGRNETVRPPSEATIWRVLVRRGFVVPEPRKRPKASLRRFEAAAPNELWQIDATDWALADGSEVEIVNILDDHSRLCAYSQAVPTTTSELAWAAFRRAVEGYGWPAGCLSDNGLAFSGRLKGFEVVFERRLRAGGVRPITARPFHPQTCGKVERFQQTQKKWLRSRRRAAALAALQAQLDEFREEYNRRRPHRGIGRATPWERWSASPRAVARPGSLLPSFARRSSVTVSAIGTVPAGRWVIGVGSDHAAQRAEVLIDGHFAAVFIDGRLVRELTLDASRRYQPTGKPPGRRPSR
jgi:transposase InsO family protein